MSLAIDLEHLETEADVLAATGGDPCVRASLRSAGARGWLLGPAVVWHSVEAAGEPRWLGGIGPAEAVAELLHALADELPRGLRATLPRGTVLEPPLLSPVVEWDFRWLAAPPPAQAAEAGAHWLADADEAEVSELLALASPRSSSHPGDDDVRRWAGIRDADGRLVACAADTSGRPDVGHLSAIATLPAARGRGLGASITAWITRQLFAEGCDIVTLGMYADNAVGRRLYDALGFRDEHPRTSGPLFPG